MTTPRGESTILSIPTTFLVTATPRIDWQRERDRIDLVGIITGLLGPHSSQQGSRLLWRCPFHEDQNPSFVVDTIKRRWKCYPCGIGGDAVELVIRHNGATFPEAVAYLTGHSFSLPTTRPLPRPKPPARPSGLPEAEAMVLVVEAEVRLWSPEGSEGLAYLSNRRHLSPKTIRAARLGWTLPVKGVAWEPPGLVIPWFDGGRLSLVKLRPPDAWRESFPEKRRPPKYIEAFRDRPSLYPGPGVIQPGRPVVIGEGELDVLLLGQELGDLVSVVTFGGTGATKAETPNLELLVSAPRWFIATDADPAGDKAADGWPARARRVRPPGRHKDWSEARQAGVNLRRWWTDRLEGIEAPPLFTWPELAAQRWGPAANDPEPGIVIDQPDPERRQLAWASLGTGPGDAFEGDLEGGR
jgi:hypothetical protein